MTGRSGMGMGVGDYDRPVWGGGGAMTGRSGMGMGVGDYDRPVWGGGGGL